MIKEKITAIAAILIFVSCTENINGDIFNNENQIRVTTQVGNGTKAGYEGTTVLPTEFMMDINQGSNENYNYSLIRMTKEETGSVYNAPADQKLLWADTEHSGVYVKAMTLPYGITEIDTVNPMEINVCQDQRTDENINASDLLGAYTGNGITISGNDITISFSHLMSKLYVTYEFGEAFSGRTVTVNSLTLKNTCITGGYSYAVMNHDANISQKIGDIIMYHDSEDKTAEAIFYPYTPVENSSVVMNATVDGIDNTYECTVALKSGESFKEGKRYSMKMKIEGSSVSEAVVTVVNDWDTGLLETDTSEGESVLWIGTSIPAGDITFDNNGTTQSITTNLGSNNYPKMVADDLGFRLYNNARGSSFVCFYSSDQDGTSNWKNASDWTEYGNETWKGFSLSASMAEVEEKFGPNGLNVPDWLLNQFKSFSYESLIIPYIDGTKAKCTTIVLDHGYNDRRAIFNECQNHDTDGDRAPGYAWLKTLSDNSQIDSELYIQGFMSSDNNKEYNKSSYLWAMSYIIKRCLEVNPQIKIVIGNYFAWKAPVFNSEFQNDNVGNLVCAANEALGGMWMRHVVNVYQYTGIRNFTINNVNDFEAFCPDGVHPHSDETGESNRIIAGVYIKELNGIVSGVN